MISYPSFERTPSPSSCRTQLTRIFSFTRGSLLQGLRLLREPGMLKAGQPTAPRPGNLHPGGGAGGAPGGSGCRGSGRGFEGEAGRPSALPGLPQQIICPGRVVAVEKGVGRLGVVEVIVSAGRIDPIDERLELETHVRVGSP